MTSVQLRILLLSFFFLSLTVFTGCSDSESDNPQIADSATERTPSETLQHNAERAVVNRGAVGNDISESRRNAITNTVEMVNQSVVGITVTETGRGGQIDPFLDLFLHPGWSREFTSLGSGFIISEDGLIVTNEHVIGRSPTSIKVTLHDGRSYDATVLGSDEYTDIALLQIQSDRKFRPINFGNSDDIIVGEWAIAVGNPFGLFQDGQPTVTVGVISALQRNFRPNPQDPRVYLNMIQTDAAINRGNSGGPLVNSNGEVIGVNTFIFTGGTGQGSVGLSFAIPSNRAIQIINQLAETGEVQLDYDPGMEVISINRRLAFQYRLPYMQGLLVVSVNTDGPAYEAGLLPGDIITRFGEELIYGQTHAMALLREYNEGDEMKLEIIRDQQLYETTMKLRKRITE